MIECIPMVTRGKLRLHQRGMDHQWAIIQSKRGKQPWMWIRSIMTKEVCSHQELLLTHLSRMEPTKRGRKDQFHLLTSNQEWTIVNAWVKSAKIWVGKLQWMVTYKRKRHYTYTTSRSSNHSEKTFSLFTSSARLSARVPSAKYVSVSISRLVKNLQLKSCPKRRLSSRRSTSSYYKMNFQFLERSHTLIL